MTTQDKDRLFLGHKRRTPESKAIFVRMFGAAQDPGEERRMASPVWRTTYAMVQSFHFMCGNTVLGALLKQVVSEFEVGNGISGHLAGKKLKSSNVKKSTLNQYSMQINAWSTAEDDDKNRAQGGQSMDNLQNSSVAEARN